MTIGTPISGLTLLNAVPASGDLFPVVDISDTTMGANGTTKRIQYSALGASTNTADSLVKRDSSGNFAANVITAALTGLASLATALETPRAINGVNFDGTAAITVTAAAGTLTGNTLNSGVTNSSLTSVGTIATGVWQGSAIQPGYGGTGQTSYTLGDILYANASGANLAKLAGNTTTDAKFLMQLGNGVSSGAPSWHTAVLTLTGTTNRVTVDAAYGNVTVTGPQDIHTGAIPTFAGLLVTDCTSGQIIRATTSGRLLSSNIYENTTGTGIGGAASYALHIRVGMGSGLNNTQQNVIENTSSGNAAAATVAVICDGQYVLFGKQSSSFGSARGNIRNSNGSLYVIQGSTDVCFWDSSGHLNLIDGKNIYTGSSTGSYLFGASHKGAFWGATPVVQQVLATGTGKTVDNVITFLQTIGLCKQS